MDYYSCETVPTKPHKTQYNKTQKRDYIMKLDKIMPIVDKALLKVNASYCKESKILKIYFASRVDLYVISQF